MGLRCTVFGHKWGDADTEREREEEGNEVVATVREVRTCRRCGAEDVLGTSKEVTSLASRAESDPHGGEAPPPDSVPGDDEESYDPETDDGVILDDDGDADDGRRPREWPNHPDPEEDGDEFGEPAPWPETARKTDDEPADERFVGAEHQTEARDGPARTGASSSAGTDDRRGAGPEEQPSPAHEDGPARASDEPGPGDDPATGNEPATGGCGGEIIEAGDQDANVDGEHTDAAGNTDGDENPNAEEYADGDTEVDEPTYVDEDPDRGVDDPTDADGDVDRGDDANTDEETMMGPDATRRPDDDAEVLEATEPNEQSRATAQEPVDPADHAPADDPADVPPDSTPSLDLSEPTSSEEPAPEDVEYYCPECDYVDDSRWPSRRAGDVCPNCRRSYLSERRN